MENNTDLRGVAGYHHVNNNEARDLIQPYLGQDGYYLMRPSNQDGIVCTICVVNQRKTVNYRLSKDMQTGQYFIHSNKPFSSVQDLVNYYAVNPINAEAMTMLVNPIVAEENYVVMEKEEVVVGIQKNGARPHENSDSRQQRRQKEQDKGYSAGKGDNMDESLVGFHKHLPKSHLSAVMAPYLSEDGHYLLRPSSTSEGQLTLTVSHLGKPSNFKINCEAGQYYINTKKRFDTMKQLLEFYRSSPIKSKQKDAEVYLVNPIPVDKELELQFEKEAEAKKVTKSVEVTEEPLPEPWHQYYSKEHHKHYYHNPHTDATVWERPRVSPAEEGRNCRTLPTKRRARPLPQVPDSASCEAPPTASSTDQSLSKEDKQANRSRATMRERSLPSTPHKEDTRPQAPLPGTAPRESRGLLPLPSSKDEPSAPPSLPTKGEARPLPSLPPKEDPRSKSIPSKRGGEGKGESEETGGKPLPPLPAKGSESPISRCQSLKAPAGQQSRDEVGHLASHRLSVPPADSKDRLAKRAESLKNHQAPPIKAPSSPTPTVEVSSPFNSPLPPRKTEAMPPASPSATPDVGKSPPAPPPPPPPPPSPTVAVIPSPASGAAPPPPPPPPPIGLAPPPPSIPPLLSPNLNARRLNNTIAPSSPDPSGGRPFSAGDLAAGKERLKRSENPPGVDSKKPSLNSSFGKGGMADIFSSAIDSRRKVMADTDSEESEFEDVDEEWDN